MKKQAKTFRISEGKLRKIIKESVNEISYDLARKAYDKAVERRREPGGYDRMERMLGHLKDRASQNVDPELDVIVVGGDKYGKYKVKDLENNFEVRGYVEPSGNPIYNNSPLIGLPRLKGLIGPMWDGEKVRYETQEAYDFYSV